MKFGPLLVISSILATATLAGCSASPEPEALVGTAIASASANDETPAATLDNIEPGDILADADVAKIKRDSYTDLISSIKRIYTTGGGKNVVISTTDPLPDEVVDDGAAIQESAAKEAASEGDVLTLDAYNARVAFNVATGHQAVTVSHEKVVLQPVGEKIGWTWVVATGSGVDKQFATSAAGIVYAEKFIELQPDQENWVILGPAD